MRVFLVEDDDGIRTALAKVLGAHGHDVTEITGVAEACSLLATRPVDVVVVDINLPDAPGWEVLQCLRQPETVSHGARAIVMSAVPPSSERIRELHPDGVLLKPFPVKSLLRLVSASPVDYEGMEVS